MTSSRTFAKVLSIPSSGAYNPNRLRHLRGTSMHNLDCIIAQNSFLSSNINSAVNGRMSALPFKTCGSVYSVLVIQWVPVSGEEPAEQPRTTATVAGNIPEPSSRVWLLFFCARYLLCLAFLTLLKIFLICVFLCWDFLSENLNSWKNRIRKLRTHFFISLKCYKFYTLETIKNLDKRVPRGPSSKLIILGRSLWPVNSAGTDSQHLDKFQPGTGWRWGGCWRCGGPGNIVTARTCAACLGSLLPLSNAEWI